MKIANYNAVEIEIATLQTVGDGAWDRVDTAEDFELLVRCYGYASAAEFDALHALTPGELLGQFFAVSATGIQIKPV